MSLESSISNLVSRVAQEFVGVKAEIPAWVTVATGEEPRPSVNKVLWIGGTSKPANMADGDLWFKDV